MWMVPFRRFETRWKLPERAVQGPKFFEKAGIQNAAAFYSPVALLQGKKAVGRTRVPFKKNP